MAAVGAGTLERARALRDEREDRWAVFADELLSRGDARGELISAGPRDARYVARERALLAADDSLGGPGQVLAALDATWRRGFLSSVRSPPVAALRVLLTHPSAALLDELVLANPNLALDEQVELVGRSQHPGLRALEVRADFGGTHFEGEIGLGAVLTLPALKRLTALVREVSLSTRRERSSSVEQFELGAREVPLHALATWRLPALRVLELSSLNTGVWAPRAFPAVDIPTDWRALELPPALQAGAVTPRLEQLTLHGWTVDARGAGGLVALASAVAPLGRVDLRGCRIDASAKKVLAPLSARLVLP